MTCGYSGITPVPCSSLFIVILCILYFAQFIFVMGGLITNIFDSKKHFYLWLIPLFPIVSMIVNNFIKLKNK
jgi:hypothetical protein